MAIAHSGRISQGASTITQQVARNFFLSNEKTVERKIKEIFIATPSTRKPSTKHSEACGNSVRNVPPRWSAGESSLTDERDVS